ncbi:hypothetical protein EI94DRAFT_1745057, partial [Lactarius quietus]
RVVRQTRNGEDRRASVLSAERKHCRQSALAIDGGGSNSRRQRRPSVILQPVGEDERVDVNDLWTHSYIPIFKDIVPHQETRDKLLFALRDIKANEVMLGWEWDDSNAVHHLLALIKAPYLFPAYYLSHICNQMASMLHTLSSTFTTCACGSKAKDDALNLMTEFVDGRLPVPASTLPQRPNDTDMGSSHHRVNLGPLVGAQRGFHTREKSPLNGGMNGVEMIPDQSAGPSDRRASVNITPHPEKENGAQPDHLASTSASPSPPPPVTNIQVGVDRSQEVSEPLTPDLSPSHPRRHFPDPAGHSMYRSSSPSDSDPQPQSEDEEQIPPKMRKRWIHRSMEGLSAVSPSLSPCGSNISLGSVLDEGQMEVDLGSICRHYPCPLILTPQPSHRLRLPARHISSRANLSSLPLLSGADPLPSPSPSTPFLSTLTSSFLSITSAFAPIHDADAPAIQMDENEDDLHADSDPTPRRRTRSPSPQSLLSPSSEPLRRLQSPTPPPPPLARAPSPSPSSPPPHPPLSPQVTPKVKMSLKDFAMRKKKQREEELAWTAVGLADSEEARDLNGTGPMPTSELEPPTLHTESAATIAKIARAPSPVNGRPPSNTTRPASSSTSATNGNGILRRVSRSRTASPPPSPSEDSEDSEAGGASMLRSAPPTHPRSFSLSSSSSSSTTTVASTSAAPGPHRLPPSSTYRPGSSYVPPSIPPSVRPLPSGPRALRAGMGIGVGVDAGAGGLQAAVPFTSPVQFVGVPRGPSADRDRDRGWASTGRGRGRGTTSSSSWGR